MGKDKRIIETKDGTVEVEKSPLEQIVDKVVEAATTMAANPDDLDSQEIFDEGYKYLQDRTGQK